jgi:DNA-binding MarR family transcriptional regulator
MMNLEHSANWRTARPIPHASAALSQHLGQLLHLLSNAFEQRTLAKCHQRGHRKFRSSHSAIIAHLDTAGLCLGDLAERIGISQQATGKLVRDLERAGYVDSHPDIRDKRSRIILLTPAGALLQADIAEVLHEVRNEFAEILGDSGLRNFEQQLRSAANALTQEAPPN